MKKTMSILISISLVLIGTVSVMAASDEPMENGGGIMQRLRNRICDTLGICQGGCELITITGVLSYDGTEYYVDDVEVHFGPTWYITSAESAVDYDGDGTFEVISDELDGLLGTTVTIEGHEQSDQWISVFSLNGEKFREPGQPIWSSQHQYQWRKRNNSGNGPNKP